MVKYQASAIDRTFSALADPTRRHVVLRLKEVAPMQEAMAWLNRYERLWMVSLDRLVALMEERPGLAFQTPALFNAP